MHSNLSIVIQSATLFSVIVGFVTLINTARLARRQTNMQILMKYSERYDKILDEFPENAWIARFDSNRLPPSSEKLTLCILKYLNLCSEELYLHEDGYLADDIWRIWESDLRKMIASPLVRREWLLLRPEFESDQRFLKYVESVQETSST